MLTPPRASFLERMTDRSFLLSLLAMAGELWLIQLDVPADKMMVFAFSAFAFIFPEKMKDAAALVAAVRGQTPAAPAIVGTVVSSPQIENSTPPLATSGPDATTGENP